MLIPHKGTLVPYGGISVRIDLTQATHIIPQGVGSSSTESIALRMSNAPFVRPAG